MNEHPLKEMALREMPMLRQELHSLKTCQFAFLTTAFTTTGLLLGFVAKFGSSEYADFVFLAPLVVIIPCFCFFFDKAGTITRIVGYYRVLEDVSVSTRSLGWENSLSHSREEHKVTRKNSFTIMKKVLSVKKPYGYWSLGFNTFFTLILICIICACAEFKFSLNELKNNEIYIHWIVLILSMIFSILITIRNFSIVKSLMIGESSYDRNYEIWKEKLNMAYLL